MPIISKETWDKFTQEEKEKVRQDYQDIIEAKRKISFTNDEISGAKYQMELLFGKEQLQPQVTYDDVARELFPELREGVVRVEIPTFSDKEAEKLSAIGALLATAKFLNKDWKPDMKSEMSKFYIADIEDELMILSVSTNNSCPVYFRTEELAKQAIQILGENTVRLALTTDW